MLIWSIFLVILPLVIVLLYFTHVILEEAKCFFSSHRSRGTTVVSLIDLVYLGQISCVYIFKFMVLLPPKSCSNRGTTLFMLIIYATNAIIFLKAVMFEYLMGDAIVINYRCVWFIGTNFCRGVWFLAIYFILF